jgi:hypothetical protein
MPDEAVERRLGCARLRRASVGFLTLPLARNHTKKHPAVQNRFKNRFETVSRR